RLAGDGDRALRHGPLHVVRLLPRGLPAVRPGQELHGRGDDEPGRAHERAPDGRAQRARAARRGHGRGRHRRVRQRAGVRPRVPQGNSAHGLDRAGLPTDGGSLGQEAPHRGHRRAQGRDGSGLISSQARNRGELVKALRIVGVVALVALALPNVARAQDEDPAALTGTWQRDGETPRLIRLDWDAGAGELVGKMLNPPVNPDTNLPYGLELHLKVAGKKIEGKGIWIDPNPKKGQPEQPDAWKCDTKWELAVESADKLT